MRTRAVAVAAVSVVLAFTLWGCSSTPGGTGGGGGSTGGGSGGGSSTGGGTGGGSATGGGTGGGSATGGGSGGGSATGGGSGGGTGGGSATGGGSGGGSGGGTATGGLFEAPEPWTKDVSQLSPDARSGAIITALKSLGGWGNGNKLQIDFSIALLTADSTTPRQTITGPSGGGYCYGGPDCDAVPFQMPLPANGNTEGSTDYTCDTANNDCHVLVVETSQKKLYELYNATQNGTAFNALGGFIWDLTYAYPDNERGEQCTSADAAGFPIAGLLVTADEVASGTVPHAVRFILPNNRMKAGVYVHPASHAGGPSATNADAPPYGVRFRLKASFDETPYNTAQKAVLHALKTYGMLLSDGGNIAFTFADDRLSTAKWAALGIDSQSFKNITPDDFEVVDLGSEITLTYNCVRN